MSDIASSPGWVGRPIFKRVSAILIEPSGYCFPFSIICPFQFFVEGEAKPKESCENVIM